MDEPQPKTDSAGVGPEAYTHRDNPAFEAQLARRTASREAGFFLPHIRPGMRVLDVGCGPRSITLGLAKVVVPGAVIGVDMQPEQVERARALAAERGVANAQFKVANVYTLPFPESSFEAVLAHTILMHLQEPVRALREMRRVVRPEGIVGVRDLDLGAMIVAPLTPLREQFHALLLRVRQHNGSDPFLGRQHRRLLLEAGFGRAEAGSSVTSAGSPGECRRGAAFHKAQLEGIARTALAEDMDAWAERPDAFSAAVYCEAVGWVSARE